MKEIKDLFINRYEKRRIPTKRQFQVIIDDNFIYVKHHFSEEMMFEKDFITFMGVQLDDFHKGLEFLPSMNNYSRTIKAIYIVGLNTLYSNQKKYEDCLFPDMDWIRIDISEGCAPYQIRNISEMLNAYGSKVIYGDKIEIIAAATKIDNNALSKFESYDRKILKKETRKKRIIGIVEIVFFVLVVLYVLIFR